ncbi:MAG: hypothetical protein Q7S51_03170, partial [Gallionellaceae bacterium]|nr:hypothetical protein [Gallionellaceae bacterium]
MRMKNWMSPPVTAGISLHVFAIWMFLLPSVSLGAILDPSNASSAQSLPTNTVVGQKTEQVQRPQYVPGEVLVKFKKGVSVDKKKRIHDKMGATLLSEISAIAVHKVKSKHGKSTQELLDKYKNDPDVLYAEPNGLYYVQATPNDPEFPNLWGLHNTGQTITIPANPPVSFTGTADADIDAPDAWDIQTGSPNIIVADI